MTAALMRGRVAPGALSRLPSCPDHLTPAAAKEWRRVARALHRMGVVTEFDRAALAAYCQAYGRWVEAEERLAETPMLLRTPSGYVQQSPWLGIVHKQLELMGRYMSELGMTPASRSRLAIGAAGGMAMVSPEPITIIRRIVDRPSQSQPPARAQATTGSWIARHGGE